jgi:uncharacterized protein DUF2877
VSAVVDAGERAAVIRIVRLASAAQRRLDAAPARAGHVHSVFARSVNLAWHDGRLLALHGAGPLAAPFAAALSCTADLSRLEREAAVMRAGTIFRVGPLVIDASAGLSVDLAMPAARGAPGALGRWLPPQGGAAGGLGAAAGRRARAALADAIERDDPPAFAAAAAGLVGLGEGLTPAGDDCLVGALAALHRFAPGAAVLGRASREALVRLADAGTTTVAREFVVHALDGTFAEPVLAVLTAPDRDTARAASAALLRMGATSGADTLAGIRLAFSALEARHR